MQLFTSPKSRGIWHFGGYFVNRSQFWEGILNYSAQFIGLNMPYTSFEPHVLLQVECLLNIPANSFLDGIFQNPMYRLRNSFLGGVHETPSTNFREGHFRIQ